jgi:hypothetical protein
VTFGDKRLDRRLLKVAEGLASKPEESICAAIGSFHECKAAYRFFANSRINPEKIAKPHIARSLERAQRSRESLLIVHDTTDLVYSKFNSIKGLGTLTTKAGMPQGVRGIILHNSLMLSESGVPLGIIKQSYFNNEDYLSARGQLERNVKGAHKAYCIEKKASWRWIDHLQSTQAICSSLEKEVIHVADRESDIYEFLQVAEKVDTRYVVRSMANRRVKQEGGTTRNTSTMNVELEKSQMLGTTTLEIKDPSGTLTAHSMSIKAIQVTLHCPQRNVKSAKIGPLKPLVVYVVEARSLIDPNLGWRLITNLDCNTFEQAMRVVSIYKQRWTIESYHRALKSGYGIETARLSSRSRLENLCALLSVLAWRVMWLYLASRDSPESSCLELFSAEEIKVLSVSKHNRRRKAQDLTSKEAVLVLAKIGGFLGRKSDGPPGMTSIWKGWKALYERIIFLEELTCG